MINFIILNGLVKTQAALEAHKRVTYILIYTKTLLVNHFHSLQRSTWRPVQQRVGYQYNLCISNERQRQFSLILFLQWKLAIRLYGIVLVTYYTEAPPILKQSDFEYIAD